MSQIKQEVVHKVESIANDDERKLVRKFCLLEEIFLLWIVVVTFTTDPFDFLDSFTTDPFAFLDLTRTSSGLNVLEMKLRIFAEVDNRSEAVREYAVSLADKC